MRSVFRRRINEARCFHPVGEYIGREAPSLSAYPGMGAYRRYLADPFVVVGCFLLSI